MSTEDAGLPPEANLGRQTLSGLKWVYLSTGSGLVMQLFYTAVMNRLLDPVEFGLVASAQVVLRFGRSASELGMGPALIQRKELDDGDIRAAFTSSVLLGVALTAIMYVLAPALRVFFDSPDVVPVFRVLAFSLTLNTLTIVPVSMLSRQLRFRSLAVLEFLSFAVGYLGIGLTFALLGAGVWSLVAATLGQLVMLGIGAYALARHPVRPTLAFRRVKTLYSFGGKVSIITLLEYAYSVAPSAVVGRYSGIAPLGQFNRAALVVDLPLITLTSGLSRVLFPALSRIQGDRDRVREAYLSAMRTSGALIMPIAIGVAVAADELVAVLLGPQWGTAASLVPVMAATAALAFLVHYGGIVCEALDVLRAKMVLTALLLLGTIGALLLVPSGDLMAYALTLFGGQVVAAIGYTMLMNRVLDITWRQHAAVYGRSLLAGGAAGLAIWAVTAALRGIGSPLPVVVAGQIAAGAVSLLPLAWYGPLKPVRQDVLRRLGRAGLAGEDSPVMRVVFSILERGGSEASAPAGPEEEASSR